MYSTLAFIQDSVRAAPKDRTKRLYKAYATGAQEWHHFCSGLDRTDVRTANQGHARVLGCPVFLVHVPIHYKQAVVPFIQSRSVYCWGFLNVIFQSRVMKILQLAL